MVTNGVSGSTVHRNVVIAITSLLLVTMAIVSYRLYKLDFQLESVMPKRVYTVEIEQSFVGHGMPVTLSLFLPQTEQRQHILNGKDSSGGLLFESFKENNNKKARWSVDSISGAQTLKYRFQVSTQALQYELDKSLTISDVIENSDKTYLGATETIQTDSPEILKKARRLIPKNGTALSFLRNSFNYVSSLKYKPFKGTTDALTALRLGEASCNGRGRLLVALLRTQGISARLVGGLVMTSGEKKTSHQWIEARINGTWVPLDPTNGHFLRIPHHYLVLYRGDEVLFKHTSDIGFNYKFSVSKNMVPAQETSDEKHFLGFSQVFRELGIPVELLKSIIMIPLGALIVVMFRNVIGVQTFGTFLPALIAVACRNTGLFWGLLGFTFIIAVVSLMRHALSRLQLLHSPQLGVMLTVVIALLLLSAVLGAAFDINGLAKVSLFPMVIVAITAERFSIMEVEEGRLASWKTMAQTLLVVAMAYVVMSSLSLQVIMLGFPELLLAVVALNIWIGRWVGLRATEWLRFKGFVFVTGKKDVL